MKLKKSQPSSQEDVERQKQIEKRVKVEKVELDHPRGKERFERAIQQARKVPKRKD
jgi:hypothetical protein